MPKKPIEWSKCIIYKIWNEDDFYVGSTTDLASRKKRHKYNCNNENVKEYNFKIYQTIREKGGWNAWQMTPLEEYKECKSLIEARIREEEWRVKLNANLNMKKCFGAETRQEYMKIYEQEHKEEKKIYLAQYRQNHKEELNAKFDCKCGGKYKHQGKSIHEKTKKHQTYLATLI